MVERKRFPKSSHLNESIYRQELSQKAERNQATDTDPQEGALTTLSRVSIFVNRHKISRHVNFVRVPTDLQVPHHWQENPRDMPVKLESFEGVLGSLSLASSLSKINS